MANLILNSARFSVFALGLIGGNLLLHAESVTNLWIGTETGDMHWSNPDNWSLARVPTGTDTAAFRPTGAIVVKFTTSGTAYPQTLSFESGATAFGFDGVSYAYNGFNTSTGYVYVAEGAVFTNDVARTEQKNLVIVKRGKGLWKNGQHICRDSSSSNPAGLLIEEGSFVLQDPAGQGASAYASLKEFKVAKVASAYISGYNRVNGDPRAVIDGTLRLNSSVNYLTLSSLSGSGSIVDTDYRSIVSVAPTSDCTFSGSVNNRILFHVGGTGAGRFCIGSSSGFEAAYGFEVANGLSLGFAPGIGAFKISSLTVDAGQSVELSDVDGEPVTLVAKPTVSTDSAFTGDGSVFCTDNGTVIGNRYANTGLLAVSNASSNVYLTIGDGEAEDDPKDLAARLGSWEKGGLQFNAGSPLEIRSTVTGNGGFEVLSGSAKVTIDDLRKQDGTLYLNAPLELAGGDSVYAFTGFGIKNDAAVLTISGGVHGYKRLSVSETNLGANWFRSLPLPSGLIFSSSTYGSKVVQTGGELYQGGTYGAAPMRYELNGGELHFCESVQPSGKADADHPSVYHFNGGVFSPSCSSKGSTGLSGGLFAAKRQDGSSAVGLIRTTLGPKGARLSVAHASSAGPNYLFNRPLTADGSHAGGIAIEGEATYTFTAPVTMAGDLRVTDGGVMINEDSDVASTPQYFGTGALFLRNAAFSYSACSTDKNLQLANASGQGITYAASGMIRFRRRQKSGSSTIEDDQCSKQTLTTGPISRQGKGSVLFLWDGDSQQVGSANGSRYTVAGGVEMNAAGTIRQPIVSARFTSTWFLAYDATTGFCPFADYAAMTDATTEDSIVKSTADYTVANGVTKAIGGLAIEGGSVAVNGTLRVGNGTDPALVMLNRSGVYGSGTIDFGTSEGIFCGSSWHTSGGGYRDNVTANIAGSGGVTFVSAPDHFLANRWVRIAGNNTFTGGLYVNSVHLMLDGANVLGAEDVYVGGGKRYGGHVVFVTDDATYANAFHVAGYGIRDTLWDGYDNKGALEFRVDTTLTGDVELTELARLIVPVADKTVRLTGVVSGAGLEMLHPDITAAGKLVLENHNTYTGGTDLVRATLALKQGDGAGTGTVKLDQAILRFENTAPITFTNEVSGIGTIVFVGTGPVKLTGKCFEILPFDTFSAGTTLDLANAANNVYVPYIAGDTDLGGRSVTVNSISGTGTVSNGRLTVTGDIQPGGPNVVGTLAFAEGVLAVGGGARYVCDLVGDATDKLVIGGDVDVSALGFKLVRNGRVAPGKSVVLSCSGTRSGAFAAVELPKAWMSLRYGPSEVVLSHMTLGATVIIR